MNLHYHKSGHGPNILLAFHGIGQDGLSCFQPFTEKLSDYYTIYAFDLFFHGKSIETFAADFSKSELITKKIWTQTIRHFLHKENISRFDIAGFSMGGRFTLATLETFADQIDNAFLIAPDGVSEHPLYTLASRFAPSRKLFRWLMQRPQLLFKTAGALQKIGIVHSSLYRFTKHVLNTPEKRLSIYSSWVAFRKLHFDIPALYQTIEKQEIKLYLFIGKYDKLLPPSAVKELSDLLPVERYFILQSGHSLLVEKTAALLPELLAN
ncbi:alpha/beta fold hydrolase [Dyadobacter psychrotolerans]|uniref:Alpha/beta hydrolase n=1 Tax=Dyadobacter psychrotolerans TaxID=2541721 RepID=A0A4V2Z3S1_9BACT|nr:alpha/beta hydrolase [Dyadobacter psychrotolerans]TDE13788.1 alpha/beta hydrolase [Dyadobacter psychrotolerans]